MYEDSDVAPLSHAQGAYIAVSYCGGGCSPPPARRTMSVGCERNGVLL